MDEISGLLLKKRAVLAYGRTVDFPSNISRRVIVKLDASIFTGDPPRLSDTERVLLDVCMAMLLKTSRNLSPDDVRSATPFIDQWKV